MARSNLFNSEYKSPSDPYLKLSSMSDINVQDSISSKSALSKDQLQKFKILSQELKIREDELASIQTELTTIDNHKAQYLNLKSQLDLANQKIYYYESTVHILDKENDELKKQHNRLSDEWRYMREDLNRSKVGHNEIDTEFNSLNSSIKRLTDHHLSLKSRLEQAKEIKEDSLKLTFIKNIESENNNLRSQLQNALHSLAQCQSELQILPKLRHELKEATNLITKASQQLENEKASKLEIASKYNRLTEMCENSDPMEYIHYHKIKYHTDISFLQEKLSDLETRKKDIHESQDIIKHLLANISYFFRGNFMYDELNLVVPEKIKNLRPAFEILKEEIFKLQTDLRQRFESQEQETSSLAARVGRYHANTNQLQANLEQVSLNIHNQEELYKQLVHQKKSLEHDLHKSTQHCQQLTQINEELSRNNLGFKLDLSKAVSVLNDLISELTSEKYQESDLIIAIEILYKLYKPLDTDSEIKRLRNELFLSESSRLKDKELFNNCMQEMEINMSKLFQVIEENQKSSSEMLLKHPLNHQEIQNMVNEISYLKERNSNLENMLIPIGAHQNSLLHSTSTKNENPFKRSGEYPIDHVSLKILNRNCGDSMTGEVSELRDLLNQMRKDYFSLKDNLKTSLEINSKSRELLQRKDVEIHSLQRENAHFTSHYANPDDTYSTNLRNSEDL